MNQFYLLLFLAKAKCHCLGSIHPVLFNCCECGNIICKEEELEKWDVSMQILPNIKNLAEYIINSYNKEVEK